ncbi:MAG TPA: FkbM family methyltransferase [Flavobacteriaceae bacterium]|nr:FkbM family methyltransferase [Flavobacteriaceae bacterium]
MWLVCAGGKRSGSTLQYNIIAALVEVTNSGKRITHFKPEDFPTIKAQEEKYTKFKVIKSHLLTDALAKEIDANNAKVFHCFRDVRDVIVSAINKGWVAHQLEDISIFVNAYLQQYQEWEQYQNSWISRKYEDFAFHIKEEISFLAHSLAITLTDEQVGRIATSLNLEILKKGQAKVLKNDLKTVENQSFDKKTLLHINHINDGSSKQYLKKLSSSEILQIETLAHSFLSKNGYKLHWPLTKQFLSFSQHADDYIAWQLLGKKSNGMVVEIGAFDGMHLSNSYSLSEIGWEAICVEPSPVIFQYLKKNRPSAITINKAVVGDEGIKEIEFYSEEIGVLSGVVYDEEDVKKRYKNRGLNYKAPIKMEVKATTLNTLFNECQVCKVDVLSIDVEGFELEVLKGLDLTKIDVGLFIIEANNENYKKTILQYFEPYKNYVFIGSNFQNLFIMHKKFIKKKHFKNLDFENYIPAKQEHPLDAKLVIDSVPPNFEKTKYFNELTEPFRFF